MPFNVRQLALPRKRGDVTLYLRFAILFLQIVAILLLLITLGLFHNWASWRDVTGADWNDPMMLGMLLVSLVWTIFIYIRPAWTSQPLHPGHYVAWELICWVFILGGVLAVLLGSTILDAVGVSGQVNNCWAYSVPVYERDAWRCEPRVMALQKLQIASSAFSLVIAIIHFVLFVKACRVCEKYNKGKREIQRVRSDPEHQ